MKRLVIYFHYDPAGCIDTACRIAVQAAGFMMPGCSGCVAPNGHLQPDSRRHEW